MSGVFIFLTLLIAAIVFIIEPGESLLPKIKCWVCNSKNSSECGTNTFNTTCRRGHYCYKYNSKYSIPSDRKDWSAHRCVSREKVLDHGYALNECVEEKEDNFTTTRCICDKNDCNSGYDFVPTFSLSTGLECLSYKLPQDFYRKPLIINNKPTTTTCYEGYYCYKYLLGADGKGIQYIQRGCIHNKFASSIGVNINQCEKFENNFKKYPFCICDQNVCNSGNFTLENSSISSNSGKNTFQQHMDTVLFRYILPNILIPILCIVGWIGNTLCIIVLTHPDMRSPFSTLLIGLSISDSLFLCSHFLWFGPGKHILHEFFSKFENRSIGLTYFDFFRLIAQFYTIYSTLGVSIERYIATKYPLKAKLIFTRKTSIYINISILIISIILSSGELLLLFENSVLSLIRRIYGTYFLPIFQSVLPIHVLIFLNIMIYFNIQKQEKQRTTMTVTQKSEVSITKLLLCVVFVFTFCYIPLLVYYIWKIIFGHHDFLKYIRIWSYFTVTLNSSVNFIIYIVIGKKFRETFKKNCKYTLVKLGFVKNTEQLPPPTLTA